MKPIVAVDIGNSSIKAGLFATSPTATGTLPQPNCVWDVPTKSGPNDSLSAWLPTEAVAWRVASVHRLAQQQLAEWVQQNRPQDTFQLLTYRDLPLQLAVDFPTKVGVDRLVAAVAANVIRQPDRPAIVIDAGSAITVDLVAADGSFQGGTIYPGFRLSAEALFGGADLLPLAILEPLQEPPSALGKNTEAAIRSGLFWGAVGAVKELVDRLAETLAAPPQVFITGGDLRRLSAQVPSAEYVPHMVLGGIVVSGGTPSVPLSKASV